MINVSNCIPNIFTHHSVHITIMHFNESRFIYICVALYKIHFDVFVSIKYRVHISLGFTTFKQGIENNNKLMECPCYPFYHCRSRRRLRRIITISTTTWIPRPLIQDRAGSFSAKNSCESAFVIAVSGSFTASFWQPASP
jgi:hypothetical protein